MPRRISWEVEKPDREETPSANRVVPVQSAGLRRLSRTTELLEKKGSLRKIRSLDVRVIAESVAGSFEAEQAPLEANVQVLGNRSSSAPRTRSVCHAPASRCGRLLIRFPVRCVSPERAWP